ncbi:MAG: methyltransferase domain-containing protein [Acidobacteria bacterium]|nr:methyltransferase domain-containing protein [Acidobacteriota bacterium]
MNSLFAYLHRKSREKKYRLFEQFLHPAPDAQILNIGASGQTIGLAEQFESFYAHAERIVGGGLSHRDVVDYARSFPNVHAVVFDGCALPFADQSFDIVYSNAVLEHLPGWEAQQRFAEEVQRVGRAWFITTPNLWFPVEPHYHLPFVQFLPLPWQNRLVRALGKKPYPTLRLLSAREMRRLFPGSRIIGCRVTFYAETLVALGGGPLSD